MQIWEQEFAWTEADKPIKLAARALTVPSSSSLHTQPMFCFFTMVKMWYWSGLVYDYQRVRHTSHILGIFVALCFLMSMAPSFEWGHAACTCSVQVAGLCTRHCMIIDFKAGLVHSLALHMHVRRCAPSFARPHMHASTPFSAFACSFTLCWCSQGLLH